jgi:hypothetical protein
MTPFSWLAKQLYVGVVVELNKVGTVFYCEKDCILGGPIRV